MYSKSHSIFDRYCCGCYFFIGKYLQVNQEKPRSWFMVLINFSDLNCKLPSWGVWNASTTILNPKQQFLIYGPNNWWNEWKTISSYKIDILIYTLFFAQLLKTRNIVKQVHIEASGTYDYYYLLPKSK